MQRFFRFNFVLFLFLIGSASMVFASKNDGPEVIAVKFHADWCGSCKKMGPVFSDLQNKFDGQSVLFVTLDRTNISTQNHSRLLANALGLGALRKANKGTGYILLVDAKSKKVLKKLTSAQTAKEMGKAISEQLAS